MENSPLPKYMFFIFVVNGHLSVCDAVGIKEDSLVNGLVIEGNSSD
jgi:hypothetical protein